MIFKNARVITPKGIIETDFEVEEGKIKKIKKDIVGEGKDLSGYYVLPSVIDGHTHFNSRYLGAKEIIPTADDYKSGSEITLAGGITSIINFIDPLNREVTEAVKDEIEKAKSTAGIDYSFHLIIKRKDQINYLPEIIKMGIKSIKMFMAYKGSMQVDDETIYLVMKKAKELGVTVAIHAENGDVIEVLHNEYKDKKDAIYHALTRPVEVEEEAVNRASMLAYLTGAKTYIVHISSPTSLDIISYWRKKGAKIFSETCPHYLLFDDSYYLRSDGNRFIMSPPLRRKELREELVRKLHMVNTLGSDYSGFMSVYKDKALSYIEVPNGVSSTEFLVPTIMSFLFDNLITPEKVAEITSYNQIKLYNLKEKGFDEGKDADFTVIKREEWIVKDWHGKMDYSIYEGVKFKAKVIQTYLRGELTFDEDYKGSRGKLLKR
ncbi:amidohydrolase family protein [Sulfurisphaera tokodaii]|uniref:Dihydropyrimidinase n=2 Tax=Sulfurisphaera tokodaii TaxID=111955 RepID=F9VNT1_SULTO|nr:amidohydrolase family protein [Sulfurisphaera tokodaii]BAK54439.1 putative dihydropyrimidinase [Sulfurisphaera tokodaii str. 7]HII73998.1 amidohydrolase family protein [Sulfurisphaera tokodaii]